MGRWWVLLGAEVAITYVSGRRCYLNCRRELLFRLAAKITTQNGGGNDYSGWRVYCHVAYVGSVQTCHDSNGGNSNGCVSPVADPGRPTQNVEKLKEKEESNKSIETQTCAWDCC